MFVGEFFRTHIHGIGDWYIYPNGQAEREGWMGYGEKVHQIARCISIWYFNALAVLLLRVSAWVFMDNLNVSPVVDYLATHSPQLRSSQPIPSHRVHPIQIQLHHCPKCRPRRQLLNCLFIMSCTDHILTQSACQTRAINPLWYDIIHIISPGWMDGWTDDVGNGERGRTLQIEWVGGCILHVLC